MDLTTLFSLPFSHSTGLLALGATSWVAGALTVLFLLCSVVLILTILIQRPQGGGLSGAFGGGGGSGETAFGARTGDALTMATIAIFVIWLLIAVGLVLEMRPSLAPNPKPTATGTGTPSIPEDTTNSTTTPAPEGTPANDTGTPAGNADTPASDATPARGTQPDTKAAPDSADDNAATPDGSGGE